jgi:hypothetical protein
MPIPLPVITNTFRCALTWLETVSGQTAVNVIHIHNVGAVVTAADAFDALQDAVTAAMWDSQVTTAGVNTVDITPLDGVSAATSFPTGLTAQWSGGTAGDFAPATSNLIKLQTGLRGRNRRGRVFLPFLAEAQTTKGSWNLADRSIVAAAWEAFRIALTTDAPVWQFMVASYDRRHAGAGASAVPVSATVAEPALGTQRRRQGRLR